MSKVHVSIIDGYDWWRVDTTDVFTTLEDMKTKYTAEYIAGCFDKEYFIPCFCYYVMIADVSDPANINYVFAVDPKPEMNLGPFITRITDYTCDSQYPYFKTIECMPAGRSYKQPINLMETCKNLPIHINANKKIYGLRGNN